MVQCAEEKKMLKQSRIYCVRVNFPKHKYDGLTATEVGFGEIQFVAVWVPLTKFIVTKSKRNQNKKQTSSSTAIMHQKTVNNKNTK